MAGQPPHHEMFEYHQAPGPSRSPNSARPNAFAAPGFASGMTLPRQNQRGYETLGSAALYGDHINSAYRTVDAMNLNMGGGVSPANNMAYSFDSNAGNAWAYNSNVATINGAMNGASRQRPMPRRAALPASWSDGPAMNMHVNQQNGFIPHGVNGNHMGPGMLMDPGMGNGNMNTPQQSDSDQLIPTAIVIKNIPFAVRKEQLAQIMVEMNLPQPYAFNYHFDNGVFRGLAFANFQNPEDTRAVIDRMNGLDVSGRKLRVEYKKMLPEAERERIEREKRERRGQLEEQHRAPMLHQQPSLQSLNAGSNSASRTPNNNSNSSTIPTLDLNDPKTLAFYTQLTIFKSDESRETLIFPATISPEDRRQIHIIAHHMGLEHQSWGETSESRQLHIYRRSKMYSPTGPATVNNVSVDAHRRGLSRAATFDLSTGDQMRSNPHNTLHRPSPTIEYPVSNEGPSMPNNLRAAKSFADLRSMTPSPSTNSASGYLGNGLTAFATANASLSRLNEYGNASPSMTPSPTMHMPTNNGVNGTNSVDPTMGLAGGLAGLGLSYDSIAAQHRSTPGAIGSQRPSTRPATDNSTRNAPDRQPRNPSDWNDQQAANFASRGRTNGHVTRGSDSSDNASRATSGTSGGRFH